MKNKEYVIGVDLGGTKIVTALCDSECRIIARVKTDTMPEEGINKTIRRINESIYRVIEMSDICPTSISGIGISAPGPLDASRGIILHAASMGWHDVPLRDLISMEFGIPAYLENDANAAAYGEARAGAGRNFGNIVYITVSTGIGSGIVVNGSVFRGKHDAAGEFGHICVELEGRECSCGNKGCLQAYASGTAISKIARERVLDYPDSSILKLARRNPQLINCMTVEKAAYEGDSLAVKIWHEAGARLGQGISILMQLLDPDIVIIGGGVSRAWNLFYEQMAQTVKKHTYSLISNDMLIVPAQLGENAEVVGACLIALNKGV